MQAAQPITAAPAPSFTPAGALAPAAGESYEDFIVRAHLALLDRIPEPAERNAAVWSIWEQVNGDPERARAAERFAAAKYKTIPSVPLFVEHDKVGRGPRGEEQVTHYDVAELTKIIRENNHRIEDADAYTGLVDKHTAPGGARDPDPPRTLGFVGPYRLGMLGRKHPRFAIFADEHHRPDRADVLADRPRRSVEVLRLRANGRRYFDPIAALAEAPRLPLPVHHYAGGGAGEVGAIIERYSALAPIGDRGPAFCTYGRGIEPAEQNQAYPGGSNTFITSFGDKPDRNGCAVPGSPDKNAAGVGNAPMLNPEQNPSGVVRQVIDALQATPQWQALTELTEQLKSAEAPGAMGAETGDAPTPEALAGQDPGIPAEPAPPMPGDLPGPPTPAGPAPQPGEYPAPPGEVGGADPAAAAMPPAMPAAGPAMPAAMPPAAPPAAPPAEAGPPVTPMGLESPQASDEAAADQTILADDASQDPERNVGPAAPLLATAARALAPTAARAAGSAAARAAGGGATRQALARTAGEAVGRQGMNKLEQTIDQLRGKDQNAGSPPIVDEAAEGLTQVAKPHLGTGNSQYSGSPKDRNSGSHGAPNPGTPGLPGFPPGPNTAPPSKKTRYMGGSHGGHHRYSASNPEDLEMTQTAETNQTANQPEHQPAEPESPWIHRDQYAALAADNQALADQVADLQRQLEEVTSHNQSLLTEQAEHYAALQHQVVGLTQDKVDSQRRERLHEMARRFPVVNIEEEASVCLYAAGADMSDEQFEHHLATIEKYAAASVVSSPMIPVGEEAYAQPAQTDVETARYAAADADRALQIVNEHVRRGETISYDAARQAAQAERLGQSAQ